MGRPRKPSELKLVTGTYRKDRNPANEPTPDKLFRMPTAPSHLSKHGKNLWKNYGQELIDCGVLTKVDIPALEGLCSEYDIFREAREAVYFTVNEFGKRQKRSLAEYMRGKNSQTMPEYTAMTKASAAMKTYLREFGMTPSSRNGISMATSPEEEQDPMEALLNA